MSDWWIVLAVLLMLPSAILLFSLLTAGRREDAPEHSETEQLVPASTADTSARKRLIEKIRAEGVEVSPEDEEQLLKMGVRRRGKRHPG